MDAASVAASMFLLALFASAAMTAAMTPVSTTTWVSSVSAMKLLFAVSVVAATTSTPALPDSAWLTITTPTTSHLTTTLTATTLRSLAKRECFKGFECQHGYCPPGLIKCVCDPGWTGLFCQSPCPLQCGPRGQCALGEEATPYCRCQPGYGGIACELRVETTAQPQAEGTSSPTDMTTSQSASQDGSQSDVMLRPLAERRCLVGFECQHGYCPPGKIKCVCDPGWTGPFCQTLCPLDCGPHGRCGLFSNGTAFCSCEWSHTGARCERARTSQPPVTADCENCVGTTTTSATTSSGQSEVTLPLRPISERQCLAGFECQHGRCTQGFIGCICDPGWVGLFCHTPCPLECGSHGSCDRLGNGTMVCSCYWGWAGPKCEFQRQNVTVIVETDPPPSANDTSGATQAPAGTIHNAFQNPKNLTHPLSERMCAPGFVCLHGVCKNPKRPLGSAGTELGRIECSCDEGWMGVFCHEHCPLDCGNFGRCDAFKNGSFYCSCHWNYMGARCDTPRPAPSQDQPSWHWWVVGACLVLLLLLLSLLVLLPYWMWRRRDIFIMKIVYLFQPYEDEDDKQYDAFVSYKATPHDESFVVHTLYPKLEKELHFKLCLHFRDFMPGETIANNIINAVERSRRTILLLSPSYVQSEFCRFEYQRAQHEMLKRKQRIIPIVLEDISGERSHMDKTLRTILDTITYLNWPGQDTGKATDKFWKRLELCMPKKRPVTSETSVTSSSSGVESTSESEVSDVRIDVKAEDHVTELNSDAINVDIVETVGDVTSGDFSEMKKEVPSRERRANRKPEIMTVSEILTMSDLTEKNSSPMRLNIFQRSQSQGSYDILPASPTTPSPSVLSETFSMSSGQYLIRDS